ncbi:MAG: hypothetical protein Q8M08_00395 [Bacteroidales bacterium]|jgi:hypothetical protein|nr:hypothetical protein [Bacteroidales bacterium]
MTDINSYVEYFRTIAREHKEINDFYLMDINEPLAALRSNIKYPALIMTSLSGNFEASNLDNILDSINAGFLIIGHLDQIDDFSGELVLLSKMKQIGTDIIARMLNDYLKCELLTVKAIPGFNINSVSYEMLGPVFDNDYGMMYSFKFLDCLDFDFDVSKWVNA